MSDEGRKREVVQGIGIAELTSEGGITKDRMRLVDKLYPGPAERFLKINNILKDHDVSTWDVICFAAFQLSHLSLAFEWILKEGADAILKNVIFAHYYDPDTNCGLESRRPTQTHSQDSINTEGQRNAGG